jgi:solute carrier family 35 (UDP-galactose transporter), member B1
MGPPIVITAGGAGVSTKRKKDSISEEATIPTRKQQNIETHDPKRQDMELNQSPSNINQPSAETTVQKKKVSVNETAENTIDSLYETTKQSNSQFETSSSDSALSRNLWLFACFFGIMISFVAYGLLLEYATSGGRKLHELSFLFVTSGLYTLTAAAGRHVRDETPTSIPPARFAVLGLTSMGSTFCSVRSLRYVIYPIQVLAKSCKPVPVMLMGAVMGKTYPMRKYINVAMIVAGVALFMGGGNKNKQNSDNVGDSASQAIGLILLFISLCFDGGTGAYEDKLMAVHHVGPFDLMYNIQLGKTILAGVGLVVLNQVHEFIQMCQDMGFLLIALGLSGALGQVFIFVTIAKFGALTCSIIGLARKVTTLVASILFFGHSLSPLQFLGLVISVGSMIMNFWGKKNKKSHGHSQPPSSDVNPNEEIQKLLEEPSADDGDVELQKPRDTNSKS